MTGGRVGVVALALGVLALALLLVPPLGGAPTAASGSLPQVVRIPSKKPHPPGLGAVYFSHWSHNQVQCFTCHPGLFPQARVGFTHEDMRAGRYCGGCHDGRFARDVGAMTCGGCHAKP